MGGAKHPSRIRGELSFICSRSRVGDYLHSSMLSKRGTLRFIRIDEVEAAGAETTGKLEGDARNQSAPRIFSIGEGKESRTACSAE